MKLTKNLRKMILAGAALAVCTGFALNAQAQDCTVDNWDVQQGLADSDTGTQGANNRRYGGPCGLRVELDGMDRYVVDESPATENSYIARFYAFLDNAGSDPVLLFAATDGTDDQVQVWYNDPAAGDVTLRAYDSSNTAHDSSVAVGSGWHSIEFDWVADSNAEIAFIVDGDEQSPLNIDTDGLTINEAMLGNLQGADGGSIDFDDFDSRRSERPGRLLVGDANSDGEVTLADVSSVSDEVFDSIYSLGQPDCNEDGEITLADVACIADIVFD